MIVCRKHHVYCLYDCVETSLSDCSTLYWKQPNIYPWYLKTENSAVRQYFQIKFCEYFTEYFRIKQTKFTQDAFRFNISVVHCVGFTFFRTQCIYVSIFIHRTNRSKTIQIKEDNKLTHQMNTKQTLQSRKHVQNILKLQNQATKGNVQRTAYPYNC